jgi:hypothetical protein
VTVSVPTSSGVAGLSESQVAEALTQYGPNAIAEVRRPDRCGESSPS